MTSLIGSFSCSEVKESILKSKSFVLASVSSPRWNFSSIVLEDNKEETLGVTNQHDWKLSMILSVILDWI